MDIGTLVLHIIVLLLGSASAWFSGSVLAQMRIPLVTGYLVIGVLLGPKITNMMTQESVDLFSTPVSTLSLAYISFSAGAEIYFPEIKNLLRSISWHMISITIVTMAAVVAGMVLISRVVDFAVFPAGTPLGCRVGISCAFGAIMVCRSPATALAVATETESHGPFTKTMLGVTVISDVVTLILFAVSLSYARAECLPSSSFDAVKVLILLVSIVLSTVLGILLGYVIVMLLWLPRPVRSQVKGLLLFAMGYLVFYLCDELRDYTDRIWLGRPIELDALLACTVASSLAGHQSSNRRKLANILHKSAPFIFLPFFTLTGAAMQIDKLKDTWASAGVIFLLRIIAIIVSTIFTGSCVLREERKHYLSFWMTLTAQAGVCLGLANQFLTRFAGIPYGTGNINQVATTTCIAVIIANQISGPILCQLGLYSAGESKAARDAAASVSHVENKDLEPAELTISASSSNLCAEDVGKGFHFNSLLSPAASTSEYSDSVLVGTGELALKVAQRLATNDVVTFVLLPRIRDATGKVLSPATSDFSFWRKQPYILNATVREISTVFPGPSVPEADPAALKKACESFVAEVPPTVGTLVLVGDGLPLYLIPMLCSVFTGPRKGSDVRRAIAVVDDPLLAKKVTDSGGLAVRSVDSAAAMVAGLTSKIGDPLPPRASAETINVFVDANARRTSKGDMSRGSYSATAKVSTASRGSQTEDSSKAFSLRRKGSWVLNRGGSGTGQTRCPKCRERVCSDTSATGASAVGKTHSMPPGSSWDDRFIDTDMDTAALLMSSDSVEPRARPRGHTGGAKEAAAFLSPLGPLAQIITLSEKSKEADDEACSPEYSELV